MKTLYLIRHAKSSWDDTDLSDIDRPLNERGKKDAPRMGKRLKEREIYPGLMLSSPAKRAFSTAKKIGKVLGYEKESIKINKLLYHADEDRILSVIKELSDNFDHVMIFCHNPGITDFANSFLEVRQFIENIPTCGIVAFEFHCDSWKEIKKENVKLLFYDFPKSKND